jgi:hypothetical protein
MSGSASLLSHINNAGQDENSNAEYDDINQIVISVTVVDSI